MAFIQLVPLLNIADNATDAVTLKPSLVTKNKRNSSAPQHTKRLILLERSFGKISLKVGPSSLNEFISAKVDNTVIAPLVQRGMNPGPGAYTLPQYFSPIAT